VKTDANGRYILKDLAAGTYRVTLAVNGASKTSINNTTIEPDESTQLNFDLTQTRASVTVRKGIHRVWIPAFTGSRLPGRWVEVDDGGGGAGKPTAKNALGLVEENYNEQFTAWISREVSKSWNPPALHVSWFAGSLSCIPSSTFLPRFY